MRQSLSETQPRQSAGAGVIGAVGSAVALSVLLGLAALVDQVVVDSLSDHAAAMYAPHGQEPDGAVLYGSIYAVAAVGAALWTLTLRPARSRSRFAPILTVGAVAVAGSLALALLLATEYGSPVFPPVWGMLAALSPVAGTVAGVRMLRRTRGTDPSTTTRTLEEDR
jgi:hypothetical protein